MKIKLIEDYGQVYKDDIFEVAKEYKCSYRVLWTSMWGSYYIKLPKDICIIYTTEMQLIDDNKQKEYDKFMRESFQKQLDDSNEIAIRLRNMHKDIK